MHAQPTSASTNDSTGASVEDTQYYREVLNELINMGMGIARRLDARDKAQDEVQDHAPEARPTPPVDLTPAFDRIYRAIRRTMTLARHLDDPVPAHPAHRRTAARQQILRNVEDAIHQQTEGRRAERLHDELLERLDEPDLDDDIANRPVAEIVTEIIRDLGIAGIPDGNPFGIAGCNPWKRRTPADIAALRAHAAGPPAARADTLPPLPPDLGREAHQERGEGKAPHAPVHEPERFFRLAASPNGA